MKDYPFLVALTIFLTTKQWANLDQNVLVRFEFSVIRRLGSKSSFCYLYDLDYKPIVVAYTAEELWNSGSLHKECI